MQIPPWPSQRIAWFVIAALCSGCAGASSPVDVALSAAAPQGQRSLGDAAAANPGAEGADAGAVITLASAVAPLAESPESTTDGDDHSADETVEDEPEDTPVAELGQRRPHPFDGWTMDQFVETVLSQPKYLGSLSIGRPNRGALLNGIQMPSGEGWTLLRPAQAWGTQETVEGLTRCIERVRMQFPETPPIYIGHLSGPSGGRLSPHRSHQAGRDVDIGYYYTAADVPWYTRATSDNLDRPRTWALLRALITETDVEYLFIDRAVQRLLRNYAYQIGEPKAWVDSLFDGEPNLRPIVLHAKGHATHIHVRFYSPVAAETGRRVYNFMTQHRVLTPDGVYVPYPMKKGSTLTKLARQLGATPQGVQELVRLKTMMDRASTAYRSARSGPQVPTTTILLFPARRLPPPSGTSSPTVASALAR